MKAQRMADNKAQQAAKVKAQRVAGKKADGKGTSGGASRKADDTGAQVAVEERGGGRSGGAASTGAPGGHAPKTAAYTAAVAWCFVIDCGGRGAADGD